MTEATTTTTTKKVSHLCNHETMHIDAKGKFDGYLEGYGNIGGIKVFDTFATRAEMCRIGLHRAPVAGIHGSIANGAQSIVLSYKYEDDIDMGDIIEYAGTSPDDKDRRLPDSPKKLDQTFAHRHNATLERSSHTGYPVRVIRGPKPKAKYGRLNWAPLSRYRYDGLYTVIKAEENIQGKGGNRICRFTLRREPNQPDLSLRDAPPSIQSSSPDDDVNMEHLETTPVAGPSSEASDQPN
ncbi:PUA-like domain-containing protein [Flagelloscypha sp. PMI_526]|nr:PUA-like domain-containing protein [Flagelloscypha sp. PMI_526]